MQLYLDGAIQTLRPIKGFRIAYGLPSNFGVAFFEPKDTQLLGHIDDAGQALNHLRDHVLRHIPVHVAIAEVQDAYRTLGDVFHVALDAINPEVGLDEAQRDFAVNSFADVCQRDAYALLRHHYTEHDQPMPDFKRNYQSWVQESVFVSSTRYPYTHHNGTWQIQMIATIYGRIGMRITLCDVGHDDGQAPIVYVLDKIHACPADGFMGQLLFSVTQAMRQALKASR